jgi:hypothetical protein
VERIQTNIVFEARFHSRPLITRKDRSFHNKRFRVNRAGVDMNVSKGAAGGRLGEVAG